MSEPIALRASILDRRGVEMAGVAFPMEHYQADFVVESAGMPDLLRIDLDNGDFEFQTVGHLPAAAWGDHYHITWVRRTPPSP